MGEILRKNEKLKVKKMRKKFTKRLKTEERKR